MFVKVVKAIRECVVEKLTRALEVHGGKYEFEDESLVITAEVHGDSQDVVARRITLLSDGSIAIDIKERECGDWEDQITINDVDLVGMPYITEYMHGTEGCDDVRHHMPEDEICKMIYAHLNSPLWS